MSLLFTDSFDLYNTFSQKWDSGGGGTISATFARTGRNGINLNGQTINKNFTSRATYIVGFAINFLNFTSGETQIFGLLDSGTYQVSVGVDIAGNVKAYRGNASTLLGTGSSIYTPLNVYHYIEFKVTINGSTGTLAIQLDGVQILNLTGLNTAPSGNNTANQVRLNSSSCSSALDDVYVCDNAGSINNTFLGDIAVLAQLPSANGTTNNYTNNFASWASSTSFPAGTRIKDSNGNVQQSGGGTSGGGSHPTWSTTGGGTTSDNTITWTCIGSGSNPGAANWMAVSEYPPDDNNSYVADATVSDQDRYTFPSIAGSTVHAVAVNIRAEKDDASTRAIRAVAKSGATTADNGSDFNLTLNAYADFQGIFETDPNTSVLWTVSGVNAAEFGVKTTV